jgi:hypothetical protein
MVAPFLVDVVQTDYNVSGNIDYCWVLSIVEIFHMGFLGQVLGIHMVYYVSFFCRFPCYYLSQRKGKNCGDDFINALSINYLLVGEYL